ncbi:MAG: PD-(D/E)XK nuclease family protein [Clostridia bacterium]
MSAQVHFLLGRANTGKSANITAALKTRQQAGERAVLIVPEQYTFEAERSLSGALGGLFGVQVLSFERLNERILSLHGLTTPFLSPQGHRIVIRRAALLHADELSMFSRTARQSGFAAEMQTIFSDCKRSGFTTDDLSAVVEKLPAGTALHDKLSDIALLYRETESFLSDRYLTTDDAYNAARSLLPESFIRGIPVYLDGIEHPSGQLFTWLDALLMTASEVTISLRCDLSMPPDADLFLPDIQIYTRIRELADRRNCPVTIARMSHGKSIAPALYHLEHNLFAYPTLAYNEDAPNITVFGASDRTAEVEALADAISAQARRGVRYREMAVIVSDPDAYMPLVSRVLSRRNIPVFLDRKLPVTGHAAIDAALSAVRAVSGGYPAVEILRLVKSGYANIPLRDAEELELYLLRTGLTGSALTKPFSRGEISDGAERARQNVTAPLTQLQAGLLGRTVGEKVRALYDYLVTINLEGQLRAKTQELLTAGRISLMEEHAQVWNTLMSLLSQLSAIMGDVPVNRTLFAELLEEGLSGYAIGVVPGTSDQVLLGDLDRTKSRAVRALFIVGANEGLLPPSRGDDGLIDDNELLQMQRTGCPVWNSAEQRLSGDRLDLYTALSKARETLFISYAFSADGSELAPSPLIHRLLQLFPRCQIQTNLGGTDALPDSERTGLRVLAADLRMLYMDSLATPRLPSLVSYYTSRPVYAPIVRRMLAAGRLRHTLPAMGRALTRTLYGSTIRMSASRLERFNACPFQHFIRYGLAARDRREYTERALDLGSFYHAVLDAFIKRVQQDEIDFRTLTTQQVDTVVDTVLPEILAIHNDGIFLHNDRLRATLSLLVDTVKMSARALVHQIQAGSFTPLSSEVRFGEGQAFPPVQLVLEDGTSALLSGVIDRVDMANIGETTALRIVDYKSGDRDFDFSSILHGLTLQLPLYLLAVSGGPSNAAPDPNQLPAGMYYMPLRMPTIDESADLEQVVSEAFRLRGLTLCDARILLASDREIGTYPTVLKNVKAAGEDAFCGNLCTAEQLEALLQTARRVSVQTFGRMLDGHIEVAPAERTCSYCDYRSVCRFDPMIPGNHTRKYDKLKLSDFFALIGGDAHAMDK